MLARIKPLLVATVIALYAGTMLLGQSLHSFLGCDHYVHSVVQGANDHVHDDDGHGITDDAHCPSLDEAHHDHPADCPVCQFHSQGQIGSLPLAAEFGVAISTDLPVHSLLVAAIELPGGHSPRGPPQV